MALAKTKIAQSSITTKDNVSSARGVVTQKFLAMFPERPSGVSWADWEDDDDDEEQQQQQVTTMEAAKVTEPKKEEPQQALLPPPSPPKAAIASKPITRKNEKSHQSRKAVASKPITRKDEKTDRIESHHQRISFDTAVPKPILLNPSMKPNELGLGASRWASAEPEEMDAMATGAETPPEARPASPATPPEPAEAITPATTPAARPLIAANTPSPKPKKGIANPDLMASPAAEKPATPSPEPKKKAAEPGLMASRWAN